MPKDAHPTMVVRERGRIIFLTGWLRAQVKAMMVGATYMGADQNVSTIQRTSMKSAGLKT
jgi:hypothetical protein